MTKGKQQLPNRLLAPWCCLVGHRWQAYMRWSRYGGGLLDPIYQRGNTCLRCCIDITDFPPA
jgi:hypothetical protein